MEAKRERNPETIKMGGMGKSLSSTLPIYICTSNTPCTHEEEDKRQYFFERFIPAIHFHWPLENPSTFSTQPNIQAEHIAPLCTNRFNI